MGARRFLKKVLLPSPCTALAIPTYTDAHQCDYGVLFSATMLSYFAYVNKFDIFLVRTVKVSKEE